MKLSWRILAAVYFPIHLAVGSFYAADRVLGGRSDCRYSCFWLDNCADQNVLMLFDFFLYSGFGLVILSIVLSSIIFYREKQVIKTGIFG